MSQPVLSLIQVFQKMPEIWKFIWKFIKSPCEDNMGQTVLSFED